MLNKLLFPDAEMPIRAIAPWFGSARMNAEIVGEELRGCRWVGVPFSGGMSELAHITAPMIVVSDLHRHVVNLANVVAMQRRELFDVLRRLPFHPDVLKLAQEFCKSNEPSGMNDLRAATHYFVCVWMGRSHKAGTTDEFNGEISRRWNANGGSSNTRYRSAIKSLAAWERVMKRCSFDVMDCFEFLEACKDEPGHGLYIDAPWPDDGKRYRHTFTESQHRQLAMALRAFRKMRVVVRFGDHPLIRELYPEPQWTWRRITSRTQLNEDKAEALIMNGPSRAVKATLF